MLRDMNRLEYIIWNITAVVFLSVKIETDPNKN